MCPFRRSLTTWSPSTHVWRLWRNSGDRRLHTLEIGERQLNDWQLHRLPDVLPFCQPGVPFNTPILSLAATSSLPITWSVQFVLEVINLQSSFLKRRTNLSPINCSYAFLHNTTSPNKIPAPLLNLLKNRDKSFIHIKTISKKTNNHSINQLDLTHHAKRFPFPRCKLQLDFINQRLKKPMLGSTNKDMHP